MNIIDTLIADLSKNASEQKHKIALEKSAELGISVEQWQVLEDERLAALEIRRIEQESCERIKQQDLEKVEAEFRRVYGSRIGIDTAAHVGRIIKLSGLSEKSVGDGWSKGTVWHLVLDDSLSQGGLKREAGDLLCRPRSSLGRRTMGITGTSELGEVHDSTWHGRSVTCAQCLAIIARL